MNAIIFEKCYRLKSSLSKDPRIIELNKLEEEMNNNEEVMCLAYKKDEAARMYSDLLNIYKDDSKEVNDARKNLSLAKANLQNNPLVKSYLKIYRQVSNLYDEISKALFGELNINLCEKK